MFAAILLFSTWIVLGVPVAIVTIPWVILSDSILPLYYGAMWVARSGLRLAGIRVETVREQTLDPSKHFLFLSNHISNLDAPILIPLLPVPTAAFLKRSLMKIPILGWGMRRASYIPVERDGRAESAAESVAMGIRVLASGVNLLSFAEGTRSRDGRLQPLKKGSFYLAMESGAPVVPVSISGTENMMRKGSFRIFPGTAHIVFHAPILPGDYTSREDLAAAVRSAIASGLPEWMRS
jgi:1-acyl-sn-glycerol-3-phosphate acyltransferase